MIYKAPSPWMRYPIILGTLLLFLVFAPSAAKANTEKVIFTVKHATAASPARATADTRTEDTKGCHDVVDVSQWKVLTSPHTIIRTETILPSFYNDDVTIAAFRKQGSTAEAGIAASSSSATGAKGRALLQEISGSGLALGNREFKWYVLKDLEDGVSFELRVSYPATSPADFEMSVWTLQEAQEHLSKDIRLVDLFPEQTMFARIKATYTGVSYRSHSEQSSSEGGAGPETLPVPFNVVLERLYFMIPYQALKLAAVIAVVAVVGIRFLGPRVHQWLGDIASSSQGVVGGARNKKMQ
ncbi:hypothetical protein BG011_004023 [Mortierella polycephala]|uniref:ER membrane protein complex subunit 10 n=1 Tax=Mortierella polycephala TaxID=41804 RepID=A0A9P6Q195_9FUNG|nr:hypothetical protein BG011_004023 [Mortierella polycephala]